MLDAIVGRPRAFLPYLDPVDGPPECASCGGPIEAGAGTERSEVYFCESCRERSHLGDFSDIYVELGGGD
jgi:hypothetical protein